MSDSDIESLTDGFELVNLLDIDENDTRSSAKKKKKLAGFHQCLTCEKAFIEFRLFRRHLNYNPTHYQDRNVIKKARVEARDELVESRLNGEVGREKAVAELNYITATRRDALLEQLRKAKRG